MRTYKQWQELIERKIEIYGSTSTVDTLALIATAMDGKHWDADTLQLVAQQFADYGYPLAEPTEGDAP